MRRREFLGVLSGAAATWPLAARAQQSERMQRISALTGIADNPEGQARLAAFRQALALLGWTIDRNLRIDYRFGLGKPTTLASTRRNWPHLRRSHRTEMQNF